MRPITLAEAYERIAEMKQQPGRDILVLMSRLLWNDLLFSLTFISSDNQRTIQTGLLNFTGQYGQVQWGPTFAAVSLTVFPTLIVYLILNQQVIKGLTAGSVKG